MFGNKSKRFGQRYQTQAKGTPNPPSFTATVRVKKRFRFTNTAAITSTVVITSGDLATLMVVGVTTTTVISLIDSIRIKKLEVWGAAAPGNTVAFEFESPDSNVSGQGYNPSGPSRLVSDTSMGMTYAPHVVSKPPWNSASGMWISGNTTPGGTADLAIVAITQAPANSIFDLTLEFSIIDVGNGQNLTVTSTPTSAVAIRKIGTGAALTVVSMLSYTP